MKEYRNYFIIHVKTALRGGFKLMGSMLLIALYTGLIMAASILFSSYSSNLYLMPGSMQPAWINITEKPVEGAASIYVNPQIIDGKAALILFPTNLEEWLRNHGARLKPFGNGSLILGGGFLDLVEDGKVNLGGEYYNVGFLLEGDVSLEYVIIVPKEMISHLPHGWKIYYEETVNISPTIIFVEGLISEAWRILSTIFKILSLSLILSLTILVYVESIKVEGYLKLLTILNIPRFKVAFSLILLALPVAFIGIFIGVSLSVVASHMFSFILSRIYCIPFLKPEISVEAIKLIFWLFLSAYMATALGMLISYACRVKDS